MKKLVTPLLILPFIAACGSSDDSKTSQDTPQTTKTGQFIDSAVANVNYSTATQSGKTNSDGEFEYVEGETVTFSIGDIDLPSATSKPQVTPLDLVEDGTVDATEVVNIARFLQTLDSDGDPSNGITIEDAVHNAAANISIDFSAADFASNQTLINFIADAVSESATLVSETDAKAHLNATLDSLLLILDVRLMLEHSGDNSPFDWGSIRTVQSEKFESLAQQVVYNLSYPTEFYGDADLVVTLNVDGSGVMQYPETDSPEYEDYSGTPVDLTWEINDLGQMEILETDDYGDSWTYVLTKIETTNDGENLLIEMDSPQDQYDYARGAFLATMTEQTAPEAPEELEAL